MQGLRFLAQGEPGFWEENGYSLHGDPWKEQRYGSDDEPANIIAAPTPTPRP